MSDLIHNYGPEWDAGYRRGRADGQREADAAIGRVRELHQSSPWGQCFGCARLMPCPTSLALDGEVATDGR